MFNKFIYLDNEIEKYFSKSEDPFKTVQQIDGDVYRKSANRITKKFVLNNKAYFLKYHGPIGYLEIFKNIVKFQLPTVSARAEWNALKKLQSEGINCPSPIAIGSKGINPARSHSFIITESLEPNISLEDAFEQKVVNKISAPEKKKTIERVGYICRNLHSLGLNHRDLYLCHFLIDENLDQDKPISLIDLHRAQIRNKVSERWLIKDIGGLYHSAIRFRITERDCYRFLMAYFNCSLRDLFSNHEEFIKKARKRAFSMYMKPVLSEIDITSKKVLTEQSLYRKSSTENHRWIGLKNRISDELLALIQDEMALLSSGEVFKNEEGHLVVKIDLSNRSYFVKKYRIKNFFHRIRRLFRKTRARNSWEVMHWFQSAGISTMRPVLMYEELGIAGALNSILVTEEIEGKRLDKRIKEKDEPIKVASSIYNFFKRMQWIDFHHGDAKSSNFFISEDRLFVFDLDSAKRNFKNSSLTKRINKDKKRILRSLEGSTEITKALKLRFKGRQG